MRKKYLLFYLKHYYWSLVSTSKQFNTRSVSPRDDYDKEVKQAKELQRRRHTTTPRRPRRPDIEVYHPRRRRKIYVTHRKTAGDEWTSNKTKNVNVLIIQMGQNQGLEWKLKSGMRVGQAQRLRLMGPSCFGLTIRRIPVPSHRSLCIRLIHQLFSDFPECCVCPTLILFGINFQMFFLSKGR